MLWDRKMIENFVKGRIVAHFKNIKTDKTEFLIETFLENLDEYNVKWTSKGKASDGLDFFLDVHNLYGSDCISCNHLQIDTLEHDTFKNMKKSGYEIVEFDGFTDDIHKTNIHKTNIHKTNILKTNIQNLVNNDIYCVICDNNISSEVYTSYEKAVDFIKNRSFNPKKYNNKWIDLEGTVYYIKTLSLK